MGFLNNLIGWCNENQGFAIVALTFIYVVATISIYRATKSSVRVSEKAVRVSDESVSAVYDGIDLQNYTRKQNVRIQLYEIRRKVFSEFMKAIQVLKDNEYSQITVQLIDSFVKQSESEKHNIDFQFKDIGHVFGKQYNAKVQDFSERTKKVAEQIELCKRIYQETYFYINGQDMGYRKETKGKDIYKDLRIYISEHGDFSYNKEFRDICEKNIIAISEHDEHKQYNYYDEHIKRRDLILEFEKRYKEICHLLENELYLNDIE